MCMGGGVGVGDVVSEREREQASSERAWWRTANYLYMIFLFAMNIKLYGV